MTVGSKATHAGHTVRKSVAKAAQAMPFVKTTQQDEFRWEELQRIEKRRRAILLLVEQPFWKVLTYWDGTVLRAISMDPLFWFVLACYVAVRIQARLELPTFVASLSSNNLTIVGGFLTFFLVFYVNQNHKRYFGLYNDSMACKGRIFDVATLAVANLPPEIASRLVRYMNAAHAAGYVGLSKIYPSQSFFKSVNDELGLLTEKELARMNEIDLDKGGSCNRELIAWCMMDIQQAKKKGLLDKELANMMRDQVLRLRASIGALYNAADLPIPFFYVHFICLLTALYLPLFAVSAAYNAGTGDDVYWTADVVAGLVVVLQSIFVIGLRVLGKKMSDPYGDDLIDLSVMHYVNFTWMMSNRILESYVPEEPSMEEEQALKSRRKNLGSAWEPEPSDDESVLESQNTDGNEPVVMA
jgi:predicted membrane chloride channel (bestrophin family)